MQRGGQPLDVGRLGGEQVEGDALRALRTDARQPPELVDQVLDRAFVHAAARGRAGPRPPRPPATGPIFSLASSVDGAVGVADRGDDEVLQRLDVVRVDGLRVDGRATMSSPEPRHGRRDQAAAGGARDLGGGELRLRGLELLLHLLRLLHQLLHVRLLTAGTRRRAAPRRAPWVWDMSA